MQCDKKRREQKMQKDILKIDERNTVNKNKCVSD